MSDQGMQNLGFIYHGLLPFMHLFLSNDPPSEPELVQLSTLHREIETLFNRDLVAGSTTDIGRLLRYDPLRTLRESLKGAVSSIRRLPDDVIAEIFLMCLQTSEDKPWNLLKGEPWTLTMVCKQWREIALADQRLWSCIDFGSDMDQKPRTMSRLETCLSRSGQRPLWIRFGDTSKSLLRILLPHSDRWQFMSLGCFHPDCVETLQGLEGRLSKLQELLIYPGPHNFVSLLQDYPFNKHPFKHFEIAPNLRKATIYFHQKSFYSSNCWLKPTHLIFPWHQLTSLKTDDPDALTHCNQLVDCELDLPAVSDQGPQYRTMILPNLRTLTTNNRRIFEFLVLPSLESLSLTNNAVIREDIQSLLLRSRCTLKTLDISKATINVESDLPRLIADLPDLSTVIITKYVAEVLFKRDVFIPGWRFVAEFSNDSVVYKKTTLLG